MKHRGAALLLAVLAVPATTAACTDETRTPRLSWYINPDDGGQVEIARRCTDAAEGRYHIETSLLPNNASAQREQLVRRLAARDSSIDIMSLDPVFVPEFAEAGFLAPIPADAVPALTEGMVEPAVLGATWRDELVAAPMWANTQLLWYRRTVAEKAGLDPSQSSVTWHQIIDAARSTGTTVAVQGNRYEGYTVLINALVESAGGHIIENPGAGVDDLELGIDSPAGEESAEIIRSLANSGVAGPSLSTSDEEAARSLFQGVDGGFMVNWPYVWRAANAAADAGTLPTELIADVGWARYPAITDGTASRPPLGGIDLGIGNWSAHPELALDAIRCITSAESLTFYFLHDGNPAARVEVFDAPQIQAEFPMADLIRESLEAAAPRPRTEFYADVSSSLQRRFHPPESVRPSTTPASASALIEGVLKGEVLL